MVNLQGMGVTMSKRTHVLSLMAIVLLTVERVDGEDQMTAKFSLTSSAFSQNEEIPSRLTCDGENVSPPLSWSGSPSGTKSFALIVDDPDAPDPENPKVTWVHWIVYNIPPEVTEVVEDLTPALLGAKEGVNDWKRRGYGGPCPPVGRHRYVHKLYALDTVLPDLKHPDKSRLEGAMEGHILAQAKLIGTYQRVIRKSEKESGIPPYTGS